MKSCPLKYLCSLLPLSEHYYFCFSLQIIDLLFQNMKQPFLVAVTVVALSLPKLIQMLRNTRDPTVVHSVPIPHSFVHKSKRTELFQISKPINPFFVFICIRIYPLDSICNPNQQCWKTTTKAAFLGFPASPEVGSIRLLAASISLDLQTLFHRPRHSDAFLNWEYRVPFRTDSSKQDHAPS